MCDYDDISILESLVTSSSEESSESDSEIYTIIRDASSDADSMEEKLLAYCTQTVKKHCIRNFLLDIVPSYNEEQFIKHFRISKSLYESICKEFQSSNVYKKLRPDKRLPVETHLSVFLWFAGHENCSIRELANRFTLSGSTIYRVIERTIDFLFSLSASAIKWPSAQRMEETSSFFQSKTGFSNIIGAIDVTRLKIDNQNGEKTNIDDGTENASIDLQVVCDERKKFLDIFIGSPGSLHKRVVFQNSPIYDKLEELCGTYRIIGDCAYPCMKNLLTPYTNNHQISGPQRMYNIKLNSCRTVVEHTLGMLQQRFPQLKYCKLNKILWRFVQACCVLHNLADESDINFSKETTSNCDNEEYPQMEGDSEGLRLRDELCRHLSPVYTCNIFQQ